MRYPHPHNVYHLAPRIGENVQRYLRYWTNLWLFFGKHGHISANDYFHYSDGDPDLWADYPYLRTLEERIGLRDAYAKHGLFFWPWTAGDGKLHINLLNPNAYEVRGVPGFGVDQVIIDGKDPREIIAKAWALPG